MVTAPPRYFMTAPPWEARPDNPLPPMSARRWQWFSCPHGTSPYAHKTPGPARFRPASTGTRRHSVLPEHPWRSAAADRQCPAAKPPAPYRKPTQVDRERIPRPTEEALSRNSAKWPRNFGRRGARETGPQRTGPSNYLAKTQVYAKPQGEVYELTPARCRKVKGSAQG